MVKRMTDEADFMPIQNAEKLTDFVAKQPLDGEKWHFCHPLESI
jgi:hypothetical protein